MNYNRSNKVIIIIMIIIYQVLHGGVDLLKKDINFQSKFPLQSEFLIGLFLQGTDICARKMCKIGYLLAHDWMIKVTY